MSEGQERVAQARSILVLGFGNPIRADDGLGPAFAARIARLGLAGVETQSRLQLGVEDAALVAQYDVVLFADALAGGTAPFMCRRLRLARRVDLGTHTVDPPQVLRLARLLYAARVRAYLLAIRGYEFDAFREGLSARARRNLAQAVAAFRAGTVAGVCPP